MCFLCFQNVSDLQDFCILYPDAARKLFENWTTISERILPYAQREGKLPSVLGDMTPAAKEETALKVLPTLLPPSIYTRGGKVFRPTTEEAQKSFIDMQPVGTNMVEYLNHEMTGALLHILCLSDETRGTSQTCAIIPGHAIETESLLEAVDLCFKAFFVFDVQYTKQCLPTWEFLQHAVYQIEGKESSSVKFLRTTVVSGPHDMEMILKSILLLFLNQHILIN
ncbi:uncharacterized protein LOC127945319 [Carassius gibelio]|uniref:uncharacterized protein LOC127945319 n=1 Tax=Carassius gibelio TaxID=101364 RepID=UPI002279B321|nr:uncharacterized protein LOC127945319 [Carassius gibelio]